MNNDDNTIEAESSSRVAPATLASLGLSIVRDDPAFRLQRKLGLIPETGLGIARRALFWSLLAWLPIAVWAAWTGRARALREDEQRNRHEEADAAVCLGSSGVPGSK